MSVFQRKITLIKFTPYVLVFLYILSIFFDMYYKTADISLFYFGKHGILILLSLILLLKSYQNLNKKIRWKEHFILIFFIIKIINTTTHYMFGNGYLIFILQDISFFLFILALILYAIEVKHFLYIHRLVFYTGFTILFLTFLYSYISNVTLIEIWARNRLIFGYTHPGYLGTLFLVTLVSGLITFLIKKPIIPEIGMVILLVIGLIMNQSRNAILTLIIFILFSIIFYFVKNRKLITSSIILITIFTIVVSLLGLFFFYTSLNRISSYRLENWEYFIKQYVLDGNILNIIVGDGTTMDDPLLGLSRLHVDNYYLEITKESGLLLMMFLLFSILIIYKSLINRKGILASVGLSSLFCICFYGMFDSAFFTFGNIVSVFFWFNVFSSMKIDNERNDRTFEYWDRRLVYKTWESWRNRKLSSEFIKKFRGER